MKLTDVFDIALGNIRHRNLRSYLTILGIVIGVASIVSLISISIGISSQINSRINTLGSNIITVSPGGAAAQRVGFGALRPPSTDVRANFGNRESAQITFREADELRHLPGVLRLDARTSSRSTVSYKDKNASSNIVGTEPEAFKDSVGTSLYNGRYLSVNDQYSAVVGFRVANSTFNDLNIINRQITINGLAFRVVGILNQTGGSADGSIFIPQKVAKNMFNQTEDVSQIIIVVSPDHQTDDVASSVESMLLDLHKVTKDTEDFQVITASSIQSTVSGISDMLSIFLGGIASISLIVGGIGVANTMFMSVLEQTKQIGVLKSIGAKNRDIILIFVAEAAIIGFIGGIFGILLSFISSYAIGLAGLPTVLSPELIAGGLVFSILIGIIAGVWPARSAAKVPPVEALRYE